MEFKIMSLPFACKTNHIKAAVLSAQHRKRKIDCSSGENQSKGLDLEHKILLGLRFDLRESYQLFERMQVTARIALARGFEWHIPGFKFETIDKGQNIFITTPQFILGSNSRPLIKA
ncbi:uncharacterized protein LOC124895128 isoform X2 [Capsicum annuum]|uniref:uncharacterized protein LOC124895128 isoform X2 n=1 Tax=Capsicum annuum TaxID=4072 RepID=UPI001FB09432|nr:uncharacterized protein LOC124895128 isoform X2 [Capsicum annuum]